MAPRVFLGLNEVAGYFTGLEQGLTELGIEARFWDLSGNPFGYRPSTADSPLSPPERGRPRSRAGVIGSFARRTIARLRAALLLPAALIGYDTFVLAGGMGFLFERELPILRAFRKRVVVVYLGSDHRPPYLNGAWMRQGSRDHYRTVVRDSRRFRNRVRRAERWAHAIVALPASAQFHKRMYYDFLQVGYPVNVPATPPVKADGRADQPVRVLHCPTKPEAKGSPLIRAAIDRLRDRGIAIEYRELSGVEHHVVLDAIAWSDFVVDEVFSDTPMAAFSTEAAHLGRPAVVCGYYARAIPGSRPASAVPPTLFCEPADLERAIERMATDGEYRSRLGTMAQEFVNSAWSPTAVAIRILRIADGSAPVAWQVEPGEIAYFHGWGIDEDSLRVGLRDIVDTHGPGALQLDDLDTARQGVLSLARVRA